MKNYNRKCLILNADMMPINVKHWTKAMCLIVKNKATQVDFYKDDEIRANRGITYPVPAVIVLHDYIVRNYKKAPFNKQNVFNRDKYTCQYCGQKFKSQELTLDHVIPRSKWSRKESPTCWTNIVTACLQCNSKKADKSCKEFGRHPINNPKQPSYDQIFLGLHFGGKIESEWIEWLSVFPSFRNMVDPTKKTES